MHGPGLRTIISYSIGWPSRVVSGPRFSMRTQGAWTCGWPAAEPAAGTTIGAARTECANGSGWLPPAGAIQFAESGFGGIGERGRGMLPFGVGGAPVDPGIGEYVG